MSHLRTPLSQVKGLGSAKEGTGHFWVQRLWISSPFTSIMLILFLIAGFYHAKLGLQTVIEDYIGNHSTRTVMIIAISFLAAILAVTGVFSVLRIAFAT